MNSSHQIQIYAPLNKVFLAVADVARWPEYLPHYRFNRFISHNSSGGVVKMCYVRMGIPLTWVSQYKIDTEKRELRFQHLRGALNATQGMDIRWTFKEMPNDSVGVKVEYHFVPKLPVIGPAVADWVVGGFFIKDLAQKTLAGLKRKLEAQSMMLEAVEFPPTETTPPPKPRKSRHRFSRRRLLS